MSFPDSKHQKTISRSSADRFEHIIDLRGVSKIYKAAAGQYSALKTIDLKVDKGEFVAVIGKSGSGKSTLLNIINGIDSPTSGQVFIGGVPVHSLN